MEINENIKAKDLFMKYNGSYFHMTREGDYDKYKQYNVTKDQELIWKSELVDKLCNELSTDNFNALSSLTTLAGNYDAQEILRKVIAYTSKNIQKGDSFIKIIYCEQIFVIIEKTIKQNKNLQTKLINESFDLIKKTLKDVLNNPVDIKPDRDMQFILEPIEEYIRNRATNCLNEVNTFTMK